MIFNFPLINIDLGGVLYPKNFFGNSTFYNNEIFLKSSNNSDNFWQSSFVVLEDKTLRQPPKIFDYTKYLINDTNYKDININQINLLEKIRLSFLKDFPEFDELIKKRQNKILVSLTSYPQSFVFIPELIDFIRNKTFQINNIYLFLYKSDIKYINFTISDLKITPTDKNLRSHLKYFYSMKLFRDYAIIILDDDIGYLDDTFESLFNAYIENPNIISGKRTHLMTQSNNGDYKGYFNWIFQQNFVKEANFSLILTNVGSTIFPPNILNINEKLLLIINETITCDDLTLKYLSNIKGIPTKLVVNNNFLGIKRILPKTNDKPLYYINLKNNDICIGKLNLMSNKITLKI
jgi:hypothetical protein